MKDKNGLYNRLTLATILAGEPRVGSVFNIENWGGGWGMLIGQTYLGGKQNSCI